MYELYANNQLMTRRYVLDDICVAAIRLGMAFRDSWGRIVLCEGVRIGREFGGEI